MRVSRAALSLLVGTIVVPPCMAQTNVIPPLTQKQIQEKNKELILETVEKGVVEMPGAIMTGSAGPNNAMGSTGSVQFMKGAKIGGEIISKTYDGAKIIGATVRDGTDGLMREGGQFAIDRGAEEVANVGVNYFVRSAITGGASSMTALGVAGLSFTAGTMVGGFLRDKPEFGQAFGLRGSIGDEVDNAWFKLAPYFVKEAVSGTKQVNIDDPAVIQKMMDDAARNRRQAMFNSVQRENREQQRQLDALNANTTNIGSTYTATEGPSQHCAFP